MRETIITLFALAVLLSPACLAAQEARPDPNARLAAFLADLDPEEQKREPFRIFDNLYYIGIGWVAAYLVTTSDGLVVIDSLYGEYADHAVSGIAELGFDVADAKYVLVTHGHFDHAGGARLIREKSEARVAMTAADWEMLEGQIRGLPEEDKPARDLVLGDGDTLTVGETTFTFYVTPGHTPGVLSMKFTVRDGEATHTAFVFGGAGLNFSGVERTEMYLASVRRLLGFAGFEVNVANHPGVGEVFQRAERLAERRPGEPHPFVAPEDFRRRLERLESAAVAKLEEERTVEDRSGGKKDGR